MEIQEIENYISKNENDDPGSWEYGHTPYLTNVLSGLNENDSKLFSKQVLTWKEYNLYEIADPIIFCSNKYLESDYLYIQIFSKIENIEYLEYLVQNVIWTIKPPLYTEEKFKDWNKEDINKLKSNIIKVLPINDKGLDSLKGVIKFLENVLEKRENHS